MKLLSILVFVGLLSSASETYSQETKFNLKMKNATVFEIFEFIEENSEFILLYNEKWVDVSQKVNINVREGTVEKILNQAFRGTNNAYKIYDRQITIVKINNSESQTNTIPDSPGYRTSLTEQQQFIVKGKVTDPEGLPLPGATITIVGTTKGVITDVEGNYSIDTAPTDKIVFSFLGMESQIVDINNQNTINVQLNLRVDELEEVTVVGFGQQRKESVVGSITTLKGDKLHIPARSLTTSLAGQFAGLITVQRSGEPGYDNAEFWIRGVSSFAGGTNPLVLVDGVPRDINDIEPDEIETFTLLKDASATAVFGSEGANGVILITSKRGLVRKPVITYRGEASVLSPTRIPRTAGSFDFLTLYNESFTNDGEPKYIDDVELAKYASGEDPDLYPSADWWGVLMRDNTTNTRHTLNFRGGSERMKYFVSGAYFGESGLFKINNEYNNNAGLDRFNLRSNIDIDVTSSTILRVDLSGQYLMTNYPRSASSNIVKWFNSSPPHLVPPIYSDGTISYPPGHFNHPYNMLMESGYRKEWRTSIQSKVEIDQKLNFITEGLKIRGLISYDSNNIYYMERKKSPATYYATGRDEDGNLIFDLISNAEPFYAPATSNTGNKNIYLETAFNYEKNFNNLHDVTGMLLYYQKDRQLHDNALPFRKQSLVGRSTYSYDNRYYIEASFGLTGSEQFAEGYRFGFFPAVGLGWTITNEPFFPQNWLDRITSLKLRASYGKTGNDNTGSARFLYRPTFSSSTGYSWGVGSTGPTGGVGSSIIEGRFESPELSWEIEKKWNYGIDLYLFNGKIDLTVDYFNNLRSNILMQRRTVSGVAGFRQSPYQNYGKVRNRGFDGSMNIHQTISNVNVSLRGNFTFARNKILERDEVIQPYPWMAETGTRLFSLRGLEADRLYREDDFNIYIDSEGNKTYELRDGVAYSTLLPKPLPGDIKYVDQNGDGVVDTNYDVVQDIVNPTIPEIIYGFGINLEYKKVYLGLFFQGAGNVSLNLNNQPADFIPFYDGLFRSGIRQEFVDSRWTEENPSQDVLIPRLGFRNRENTASNISSWWYRDASYIRLKNVEFGYNIPDKISSRILMKKARVYVMGQNIAILYDKIKYFDPELGNSAAGSVYPLPRTWSLGIELSF